MDGGDHMNIGWTGEKARLKEQQLQIPRGKYA